MLKNTFFIVVFALLVRSGIAGDHKMAGFVDMTNQQIDSLLTVTCDARMTITERMKFYSTYFLEMPYNLVCAGDGEYALYETYPLVNFQESNCMVFCEHVLALSISDSWDNFFNNLQQIRYKDGIIGMRTRNHYTIADWLPENNWLLRDVSAEVGGGEAQKVTRTISHKKFFQGKGITDLRYTLPDREITVDYVPKESLLNIENNLRNGDIGSLIFDKKTDIFSAHMWMVIAENGKLIIRESSNSKMKTFDTPYKEWAQKIAASSRYIGVAVMRVRTELDTPGKIILPWEIADLKE